MGNLISFRAAIESKGPNNKARAENLKTSERTIYNLKKGRIHPQVRFLMRNLDLLEALLEDARAGRTNGHHAPADQETA